MSNYQIDGPSIGKHAVRLGPPIAQGAAGTIHRVIGISGIVAKLYKDRKTLAAYKQKIDAMLTAQPNLPAFQHKGHTYVQIAWPVGTIGNGNGDFVGFVMPEVDTKAATELENVLQKTARKRKKISEFYGARVLLAANLAALMAELHAVDHHMIDMKPANMSFYPNAWYMAILDTDGFSINGRRRFPASQFSDEYIAPEARGKSPETLGLQQDLFALAAIIFRLVNNGLHPFQGIDDPKANHPTTLQERVFAGLYAYGRIPHSSVKPSPTSIHEFLEDDTRELFDRAFLTKRRPTAAEWRDHLQNLLNAKLLVRCKAVPADHGHFSKGCGLCHIEKSTPRIYKSPSKTQLSPAVLPPSRGAPQIGVSVSPTVGSQSPLHWVRAHLGVVGGSVAAMALVIWLMSPSERSAPRQTTSATDSVPTPPVIKSQPPTPSLSKLTPSQTITGTLSGIWNGSYSYPDGRSSVPFTFYFESNVCRGRSEEPNTFGNRSASKLYGNLQCATNTISPGQSISIKKTYDGTGGVSHSLDYTGIVSADLRQISGQWVIGGSRGPFIMRR